MSATWRNLMLRERGHDLDRLCLHNLRIIVETNENRATIIRKQSRIIE